MSRIVVDADTVAALPWRNGGGRTRELLTWPGPQDWALRVSLADIAQDGPFSAYPGVERWFAVVAGAGVLLSFGAEVRRLRVGDTALRFDGAAAPGCHLIDGPTRDLNLMARDGETLLCPAESGMAWQPTSAMRGLFTRVAGRWRDDREQRALAPHTLLWDDAPSDAPWVFDPATDSAECPGWWLGFTPQKARR